MSRYIGYDPTSNNSLTGVWNATGDYTQYDQRLNVDNTWPETSALRQFNIIVDVSYVSGTAGTQVINSSGVFFEFAANSVYTISGTSPDVLYTGAGGGGGGTEGGGRAGGGGGAGVSFKRQNEAFPPGNYTFTIGIGGAAGLSTPSNPTSTPGSVGTGTTVTGPPSFTTVSAPGGGYGGAGDSAPGATARTPAQNGGPGGNGGGPGGGPGTPTLPTGLAGGSGSPGNPGGTYFPVGDDDAVQGGGSVAAGANNGFFDAPAFDNDHQGIANNGTEFFGRQYGMGGFGGRRNAFFPPALPLPATETNQWRVGASTYFGGGGKGGSATGPGGGSANNAFAGTPGGVIIKLSDN